jgi:hypothetical protein
MTREKRDRVTNKVIYSVIISLSLLIPGALAVSKNLSSKFTVPMSNERIIKIVNKHKVITDDKPLPCHICSIFVLRLILEELSS